MWVPSYIHTSSPQPSLAYCRNDCLLPTLRFAGAKLGGGLALSPTLPPHFFFFLNLQCNSILAPLCAPSSPSMKYWIYYWFVKNPHSSSYKGTCTLNIRQSYKPVHFLFFFFQSKQHFRCWLQITTKVNNHLITKNVFPSTYCSIPYFLWSTNLQVANKEE